MYNTHNLAGVEMKRIAAKEAVRGFSQLMEDAQSGPVTIEKNGRPVAVLYSYEEAQHIEELKEAEFDAFIHEGIKAADEGHIEPVTPELMNELIESGIKRANDRK